MALDDKKKANLITAKLREGFKINPESRLMLAVIEQALRDVVIQITTFDQKISALRYLESDMTHAEVCGVESAWIRRIISQVGLDLKRIKREAILTEAERIKAA